MTNFTGSRLRGTAFGLLVLGGTLLAATQPRAAIIHFHDNFTASGFASGNSANPVTGSFDLAFDNSADITDSAAISAAINIPVTGAILFTYVRSGDELVIGGSVTGAGGVASGTNDFVIVIESVSTSPFSSNF